MNVVNNVADANQLKITAIINILIEPSSPAKKYNIHAIAKKNLLKNIIDFISAWSLSFHIGIVKNSLINDTNHHIIATQRILSNMVFTYKEKNVSAHNPRHNTNKKDDNDIILTDIGIEKKFFLTTSKSHFWSRASLRSCI